MTRAFEPSAPAAAKVVHRDPAWLLYVGLVACVITLLLGTQVFGAVSVSGTTAGYYLGYVMGGLFRRSAIYLSVPIFLAACFHAYVRPQDRPAFAWRRLLPCLLFMLYALMQLLHADPEWAAPSFGRLLLTAEIALLALPLCYRKGINTYWIGMAAAGLLFFAALLFSGQLLSILRGNGLMGVTGAPEGRLNLNSDTITSASVLFQTTLAGVFLLLAHPRRKVLWLVGIPMFVCLIGIALLTGSKGPLLAFGVALSTIFLRKGLKSALVGLVVVAIVVAVMWNARGVLDQYSGAASHLQISFQQDSRDSFFRSVIDSKPTLFGNGVGSWSVNHGFGVGAYVHNSLLEVYYEMGLVGAVLFLWALGTVLVYLLRVVRTRGDPIAGFVLAYLVYGMVFSMVSGSIFGDIELLLGLVLGCTQFHKLAQPRAGIGTMLSNSRHVLPPWIEGKG